MLNVIGHIVNMVIFRFHVRDSSTSILAVRASVRVPLCDYVHHRDRIPEGRVRTE
jgi:hypothetical protein